MGGQIVPFQWRRFMFFDQERIDNHPTNDQSIVSQLKNFRLHGVFGGRGTLILATQPGFIHFISRQFTDMALVPAFQSSICHLSGLRKHSYILAVGKDEPSTLPVLKIWNYDKIEMGIQPTLTRTLKLELDGFGCLAAHENLNYMAIGFKCGKVMLHHKDIARGRHSDRRALCDLKEEITGLVFSPQAKEVYLYVATQTQLHGFCIVGREGKVFSDLEVGCFTRQLCPVQMNNPEQHVGIVCEDGVRFYGPDGMGSTCSTASDCEKFLISWQHDYLFVATFDRPSSATRRNESQAQNLLTVYDTVNKFIGFTGTFRNISHIIAEFGAIFVFTSDGMLFRLIEKDLQSKLDLLFRKNQYELAIKLAKSQRYGDSGLVKIFKHYGDHLFSKGDYISAAEQYRHTIGGLETSYVIRQLLTGAAPPAALACYLESVHQKKKATAHHTSLLLNCYIKMKDEAKLKTFISKYENETTFDADCAVRVLRSAHYSELALALATTSHQHQQVVSIYAEDLASTDDKAINSALTYVERLDPASANWAIRRYGQQFMAKSPERTTDLLKELLNSLKPDQTPRTPGKGIFSFDPTNRSDQSSHVPSFHLFNGLPGQLMNFLESIIERRPNDAPSAVYLALLEVYVQQWSSSGVSSDFATQAKFEEKILNILKSHFASEDAVEFNQNLLLVFDSYKFYPGVEFVLEQLGFYSQLLSHLADRGQFTKMANLVDRQDDNAARLQLLGTLARSSEGLDLIPRVVTGFIAKGERASLLTGEFEASVKTDQHHATPSEVIDALCPPENETESNDVPFGVIQDYLLAEVQQVDDEADRNVEVSGKTRREAVDLRDKLENIHEKALSFHETRCRACNFKLELPTVHFMCQHSYHSNCLDYGEPDTCPKCSREHKEILEQVHAFDEMRRAPSTSVAELANTPDMFAGLADLLSKGLLSRGTAK